MSLNIQLIKDILDRLADICYYAGNILEFLLCLVLITHFIRKKPSKIGGAFFHILFIGYVLDNLFELSFTFQRYFTRDYNPKNFVDIVFFKYFESITEWYIMLFMGPAMILIALNRYTAIFLVTKHRVIWSTWFPGILACLLLYPCLIGGYSFSNFHCRINVYNPECLGYMKQTFLICAISNFIFSILSLIIGIRTAYLYRYSQFPSTGYSKQIKVEHKLLIQSLISSGMFGVYSFTCFFHPYIFEKKDDPDFFVISLVYKVCYVISYCTFHYGSIILLFIFSKAIRTEFLAFYHISWIFYRTKVVSISQVTSGKTGR